MTKEEIIHMATEAWRIPCIDDAIALLGEDGIERFAALIASRVAAKASAAAKAEEREACAELVENFAIDMDDEWVCGKAAEAIRARDKQ